MNDPYADRPPARISTREGRRPAFLDVQPPLREASVEDRPFGFRERWLGAASRVYTVQYLAHALMLGAALLGSLRIRSAFVMYGFEQFACVGIGLRPDPHFSNGLPAEYLAAAERLANALDIA